MMIALYFKCKFLELKASEERFDSISTSPSDRSHLYMKVDFIGWPRTTTEWATAQSDNKIVLSDA